MPRIDSVSFGEVKIDGKTYYSDMIVWWDSLKEFKAKKHVFDMNDFAGLMKKSPQAVVIGTGLKTGKIRVDEEVFDKAEELEVKVFADRSDNAMDIFNGLLADGKKAVAVIHCSC